MATFSSATLLPAASSRARIGLFGGSFDPPHSGHLHVAETAKKRLQLDQVWWFPTPGNPLKEAPSEYASRFDAVLNLTRHNRSFRVSDVEQRAKLRYTIDLVTLIKRHCPHAQLAWIMGGDSLMTFHYWKEWQTLAKTIPVAVVARPGFELAARVSPFAKAFARQKLPSHGASILVEQSPPRWVYLPAPLNPISSTALRSG